VGGGVIQTLQSHRPVILDKAGVEVALVHVAEKNLAALRELDLDGVTVSEDADALINDPKVRVVCELIGGVEPARTFIVKALEAGKHVVTANKMLIAKAAPELTETAARNGVELCFEAAVAGCIPIIKAVRESLASNQVRHLYGILNGTCNYILTRMTYEDKDFEEVLREAQAAGFAETPPDLDIEGHDTAHKCQILASLCHSTPVSLDEIYVEGITNVSRLDVAYANEMGYVIKLLAIIARVDGELDVRVHPTLVPGDHLLASVKREFNGVYIDADIADATLYYGRGAGRFPTASAVISDIVDIARRAGAPAQPPFRYSHHLPLRDIGLLCGRYYVRFTTRDHPGVLGRICTLLGKHGVSIASCIQKEEADDTPAHIVMMTHETVESSVTTAVEEIDGQDDIIVEKTHLIRVL
ncbi:MAG TPA: homoserine dehydrogenase, partial [Candidatus Hydrogenedentes bacterium]|nr:homoserine dehydrogenase [Candidatus Hydrogenedentota bacterium]